MLYALIERGPEAVERALADPDQLDIFGARGRLEDLWGAWREDHPESESYIPEEDYPIIGDPEGWQDTLPTLKGAYDRRRARLAAAVGEDVLHAFVRQVTEALLADRPCDLGPIGRFQVTKRRAFTGHHPETGDPMVVPPAAIPVFRAGKAGEGGGPSRRRAARRATTPAARVFRGILELVEERSAVLGRMDWGWFSVSVRREFVGVNPRQWTGDAGALEAAAGLSRRTGA